MKRFIKYFIAIVAAALFSTAIHAQTTDSKTVIARENMRFSGESPDTNKIAVSMDGLGNFKWVYFTDFQDSINTGVYDSLIMNYLYSNTVRVNRDSFTDPAATIASVSDSGQLVECFTCDTIQYILDNLGGGDYSPWDTTATDIIQKDITKNVVIGSNSPLGGYKLETIGTSAIYEINGDTISGVISDILNTGVVEIFGQLSVGATEGRVQATEALARLFSNGADGQSIVTATNDSINITGNKLVVNIPSAATGYVITALDASGNATWQDPTGYGEMGFGDSTRTIALTQNVFSVVTNSNNTLWSTAAVDLHNVTYSGDSLIIDSAGTYQLNIQLSLDGTNGSTIRLGVFINGALACTCTGYQELVNNQITQLSYINIDSLNAGDVLQVVITNTASNDDVDAISGKITVNKIR